MEWKKKRVTDGIALVEKPRQKPIHLSVESLKSKAKERSKESENLFQRILNLFQKEKHYCEMVINGILPQKRVAVLVDGLLEHFEMDIEEKQDLYGAIFLGKIQNLETGLKAAFVDIGQGKNAFLHYWDVLPLLNGEGFNEKNQDEMVEVIARKPSNQNVKQWTSEEVPEKIPIGSSLLVQVIKSQIGSKGPRVTTNISLPGRYVVLTPYSHQCGISRKIEQPRQRERLKKLLHQLVLPEGIGVIFRTACEEGSLSRIIREVQFLLDTWKQIQQKSANLHEPSLLYHEPNLLERTIRDYLSDQMDRVLVDNEADFQWIQKRLQTFAPHLRKKVSWYRESIPIFERYSVEPQVEQMFSQRVPLPSGGEIVIQETEALTSVDVNTSSHKTDESFSSQFIFQANLEAAREMARQVRLRNIGGIIIVDFVDMRQPKNRRLLYDFVQKEFENDTARVQVFPVTALGLIQISRQRHKESLHRQLYTCCPYCNGEGHLKSFWNLSLRMQRELLNQCSTTNGGVFTIALNPSLKNYVTTQAASEWNALEAQAALQVDLIEDASLHIENFHITQA